VWGLRKGVTAEMSIENVLEHKIIQQIIELTKKKQLKWYGLGVDEIGYEAYLVAFYENGGHA